MASRNSTHHGASANARRRATSSRTGRGSSSSARTSSAARHGTPTRSRTRTTAAPRAKAPARGGRSSRRSPLRGWRAPVLILVTLLALGWTFYPALRIHYQESREQARLEAELEALKERNDALSAQVERLKTPEGVEELARESLGMVKSGENLYVVLDPEATATVEPPSGDEESETFWVAFLDRVFGAR